MRAHYRPLAPSCSVSLSLYCFLVSHISVPFLHCKIAYMKCQNMLKCLPTRIQITNVDYHKDQFYLQNSIQILDYNTFFFSH